MNLPFEHFQMISDQSVRVDRQKYRIQLPLPPRIDPSVSMMTVEEVCLKIASLMSNSQSSQQR